jgi:hypothetical protein
MSDILTQAICNLPEIIKKGTRHDTLFDLGITLIYGGIHETTVTEMLKSINRYSCQPPLNDHQMDRHIRDILRYAKTGKPLQPRNGVIQ